MKDVENKAKAISINGDVFYSFPYADAALLVTYIDDFLYYRLLDLAKMLGLKDLRKSVSINVLETDLRLILSPLDNGVHETKYVSHQGFLSIMSKRHDDLSNKVFDYIKYVVLVSLLDYESIGFVEDIDFLDVKETMVFKDNIIYFKVNGISTALGFSAAGIKSHINKYVGRDHTRLFQSSVSSKSLYIDDIGLLKLLATRYKDRDKSLERYVKDMLKTLSGIDNEIGQRAKTVLEISIDVKREEISVSNTRRYFYISYVYDSGRGVQWFDSASHFNHKTVIDRIENVVCSHTGEKKKNVMIVSWQELKKNDFEAFIK